MVSRRDLGLFVILFVRGAMGACNVCRNGGNVINPGKAFTMNDVANNKQVDWTCGWLEESVADVNPAGAQGEAFLCGLAQLWAELECSCNGPPVTPLSDNVIDPNPACDLCAGSPLDFVPGLLKEELAETGVAGRMPCEGLYHALSEGVLSASLCPTVRSNAGAFCCSYPDSNQLQALAEENNPAASPGNSGNTPANTPAAPAAAPTAAPIAAPPACAAIHSSCENQGCCTGICAMRVVGEDRICSAPASSVRQSVSGNQGGAGGAAKYGN